MKEDKRNFINGELRAVTKEDGSISKDTFEVVFVTETPVLRYDWHKEEYYNEVLSCKKEHIRLARLDAGLPLFDNHPYNYSSKEQLGRSINYNFEGGKITSTIKWGANATEELRSDVENKIVTGVSCGYSLYAYEQFQNEGDEYPTRKFTDWEIQEISLAPVNADPNSATRSSEPINLSEKKEPKEDNFLSKLSKNFKQK